MHATNRLILMCFCASSLALAGLAPTHAATRSTTSLPSDTLRAMIDRWVKSVGGEPALARIHGMHLRGRGAIGGVPSVIETWIARDGLREVALQDSDRSELVCGGSKAWIHDWNGKTRALEGRDRGDALTDAFVRALVFLGPSRDALARAGACDAGTDSSGALRIVRLAAPEGGVI